jgi:hypothetical protein
MKLNVLLAKTDALAGSFRALVSDYFSFFKSNQGDFKGEIKTYDPKAGMIDLPGERSTKTIVTTVEEKLEWLEETSKDYIDALFSQEATNASGAAKAELVVDGKSWGTFSSLELLRLKSLVENGELDRMYQSIPVRSDSEIWNVATIDMYKDRKGIFQSNKTEGTKKSVTKESYILTDPNITAENGARYTPQVASKDTIIDLGEYTYQKFTGEWSHRERAALLRRKQNLNTAIIETLKTANDAEVIKSELNSKRIFDYLHRG